MSATEVFFLALGLSLGVAVGAAFLDVVRAKPPRPEVRLTITHNALPRRDAVDPGAASVLSSSIASLRDAEISPAVGVERIPISIGRGVDPVLAALREPAVARVAAPAAVAAAGQGATIALAEHEPTTDPSDAPTTGTGTAASAPAAAQSAVAADAGPCAALRRQVEERCAVAARAHDQAEATAAALREARRAYDDVSARIDGAARASDPRAVNEAKETARHVFRTASEQAASRADLERAATTWLSAINDINRATREAAETITREGRIAADLLTAVEKQTLDVDAARITAEAAAEACRNARQALATCEESRTTQTTTALPAPAGVDAADAAPGWDVERGGPPAIARLLQGDRAVLGQVVTALAGDDPTERRRYQLLLSGLVDAIVAGSIAQAVLDFPAGHPFWSEFDRSEGRDVVVGLASLGYRYDGVGGFVDGRVPGQRDLSLAVGYAGLDPMRIRRWPDQAGMAELFRGVSIDAGEYLAGAAPQMELSDMLTLLGRRSEALADLWNAWGRARPVLLEPVAQAPSIQADHP